MYIATPPEYYVTQELLNSLFRREPIRTLSILDRSRDINYIMHIGATPAQRVHPDELKVLDLHYDILKRYQTKADRPDMRWYLTR